MVRRLKERKKVNHCAHCDIEAFCEYNDWCLAEPYDPCCPNIKPYRQQEKVGWE